MLSFLVKLIVWHYWLSILQSGQPELIALEKALKDNMVSAGTAREVIGIFVSLWQFLFGYI